MNNRGLTLLEVLVIIVVIGILASLLLPSIGGGCRPNRTIACASNLQQLYKLGTVYASSHKGAWPDATGEDLWLSFTRTIPPLIEADHVSLLSCPLRDEEAAAGECHYRGPRRPWAKLGPNDVLAADREGNHG